MRFILVDAIACMLYFILILVLTHSRAHITWRRKKKSSYSLCQYLNLYARQAHWAHYVSIFGLAVACSSFCFGITKIYSLHILCMSTAALFQYQIYRYAFLWYIPNVRIFSWVCCFLVCLFLFGSKSFAATMTRWWEENDEKNEKRERERDRERQKENQSRTSLKYKTHIPM